MFMFTSDISVRAAWRQDLDEGQHDSPFAQAELRYASAYLATEFTPD